MIRVMDLLKEEQGAAPEYHDERIASYLSMISFSESLRAFKSRTEHEKEQKKGAFTWLTMYSEAIAKIPVLNFDRIKSRVNNDLTSCDGFFYNYNHTNEREMHFLLEMKNVNKSALVSMLDIHGRSGKDSILRKVQDSVLLIRKELEFGGAQEHGEIVENTHLLLVYGGKNDLPARNVRLPLPSKKRVERGTNKKQARAVSGTGQRDKAENDLIDLFGRQIERLGMKFCETAVFPGNFLPKAKKSCGTKGRWYTIFTAQDFAEIIDRGFFRDWPWGEYSQFWKEEIV